jgi:hypothetical protein
LEVTWFYSWRASQMTPQEENCRLRAGIGELQDQIKIYQDGGAIVENAAALRRRVGYF